MSRATELDGSAALDEGDDGAPLPWATWLRVSARRLKRDADERAEVLAAEEIEPSRWTLAERYWNLTIAERLSEGDFSLSDQVAAACVRELAGRKQAASPSSLVTGESAAPSPSPAPVVPAAPAPVVSAPVPAMAARGSEPRPSFLLREEPTLSPPAGMAPSGLAAEPPTPPGPPHVAPPSMVASMTGKTPLDRGTAIGAIPGVPALPFAPSGPGGDAVERAKQHASEAQPAAAPPRAPLGETEAVDVGALARRVLAFGPAGPGEPEKAPPKQPAPALPMLTVEQYASLCVDLELSSQGTAEVLRRYGVSPEGKRTLDDGWGRVFAEQPARRAAFEHAKVTYRAWLARGGR